MTPFVDLVQFNPTAGGTTDWTFSSSVGGAQSPVLAGAVNGALYKVYAVSNDLTQWEVSQGVYNSSLVSFARTTVLYNSSGTGTAAGQSGAGTLINFTTVPKVSVVLLAEDMGPLELTSATLQVTPTIPTGTSSTSVVMMGLGSTCKITPVFSSRVKVLFIGVSTNSTTGQVTDMRVFFGTGSAPANGVAQTGTQVGTFVLSQAASSGDNNSFTNGGLVTGLTPGVPVWFDIGMNVSGGTGSIITVACTLEEF
jgi:hypothetical protein